MRAPTFAKEGIVKIIVLKMTLKNLALVTKRKIRPILKARANVTCLGPKFFPGTLELIIRVIYETRTIKKSKMFQPFVK